MMRSRRLLRATRVGLLLLVAATFVEGPARAQDAADTPVTATALGGFQGRGIASGLHVFYGTQGLLPIPSLVDLGAPDALATIASGPATFARASVADPGDLLANPDALLALASSAYESGTLPAYPYRVSASSSSGEPSAVSSPAPGFDARVSVDAGGSNAIATLPASNTPAIMSLGTLTSTASTSSDENTVRVSARSELSNINILNLISIEGVVTDLTASSDGTTTEFSGGTTVTGATLAGQPITIDADGIHLGEAKPGDPLSGIVGMLSSALNDAIESAGIHVTLAGPVELSGGGDGQLSSAGLRIDLDLSASNFPALMALIDSLPPIEAPIPGVPGIEDVLQVAKANNIVAVELGRAQVALAARPGFETEFTELPPSTTPSFTAPSFQDGGFGPLPTAAPTTRPGSVAVAPAAELPTGEGIAGIVALALLVQPFIGARIAAAARALLGLDERNDCLLGDQ